MYDWSEKRFGVITRNQFGEDEKCSFSLDVWKKHRKSCFKKEGETLVQLVDKIPVEGYPNSRFQEVCRGCKNRVLC